MPETPRYLVAKKRYNDARACFRQLAIWNRTGNSHIWDTVRFDKEAEEEETADKGPTEAAVVSWRDIWAIPVLKTNLWAAVLLYVEATFNYYLLTFYMKYFPGNIFTNSIYFAVSDLLAYFGAGVLLKVIGMKKTIWISATLALVGGLSYLFLSNQTELVPMIICLSRFGQSMIFNTTLICVNKLFPTLFVSTAYGILNFCAHCFACLSPFVAEIKNPYPFSFFCSFVLIAIFSSFFLTEIDDQMSMEMLAKQEAPGLTSQSEKEDFEVETDFVRKQD